ncbi:hypothetical protein H9Y04_22030 [Streptomyces sp. TRM66268-LWL]|uniref:RNA polymerase sigma-70 region 2 domain-containing protein n=1 Tax=Streptomyces polyasparticus TaxID=2767826 RepID=A0ABR7SIA0_9ACTN|nr:sigma factor [Streptomyces polyasparticus]MBC9715235.1 hypothetical protein [Streptomyces polyasparticus]
MTDGPAVMDVATYARIYEEQQPHLVAYARSLTGDTWLAEDVVAEAHFRVWRRLSAGHGIDNIPAYLTRTVRNLATTVGSSAARETPVEPESADAAGGEPAAAAFAGSAADPSARVAHVDLLSRVLGQLPERWVTALWLAEAEDQPLDAVGRRIGAGSGATAVLLHRAREGMRQAFLRAHPGEPQDSACETHWERIPALVRDAAAPRHAEQLHQHMDACEDCRARFLLLTRANSKLGALVGPALLVLLLGGGAKFLVPFTAGAGAVASGAATGSVPGAQSGALHAVRHAVTGGLKLPALAVSAVGVSVTAAVLAAGLLTGGSEAPVPSQRVATQLPAGVPKPSAPPPATPPPATAHSSAEVPQQSPDSPAQEPQTRPGLPADNPPAEATAQEAAEAAPGDASAPDAPAQAEPQEPAAGASEVPGPVVRPADEPAAPAPSAPTASEPVEAPVTSAPGNPPSTEPTPLAPKPVDPAPVDPTPVQPVPSDPPPSEPPAVEPPAVEPEPVEPLEPVEPEPVEPVEPVQPEPVEPAPQCHDILRGGITITICYSAGG